MPRIAGSRLGLNENPAVAFNAKEPDPARNLNILGEILFGVSGCQRHRVTQRADVHSVAC
jgi:hypothetical protein